MAQGIPEGLAAAAASPSTSPEDLRMIAYQYPSLRAVVAANPAAYAGLLEWLGQLGDPDVDQALLKRMRRQNPVRTSVFPTATQPASFASSQPVTSASAQQQPVTPVSPQQPQQAATPVSFTPQQLQQTFMPASVQNPQQAYQLQQAHQARQTVQPQQQNAGFVTLSQFQASNWPGQAEPTPQPKNRRPIVIIAILLALILVLSGISWFLINNAGSTRRTAESGASAMASQTEASQKPSQSPSTAPDPSAESPSPSPSASSKVRFPAPNGALNASSIQSPTGNIRCSLQGGTVMCSLADHDFSGTRASDCGAGVATTVGAGEMGADLRCDQGLLAGGSVLQYGQTAVSGDVACSSFENGMSCWNTVTGKGFAINRSGWKAGTNGVIGPNQYGF